MAYHQYSQNGQYQEHLRGACAAKGGKITLTNLCINVKPVDTPGSLFPVIRDAVAAADLVVLPTKPMPIDLFAQEDVINIVEELGLLDKVLFVLTHTETRSGMTEKARDYLSLKAKHPIAIIPNRIEYGRAAETGGTACEENKQCKKEIKNLWEQMLAIMTPKTAMTAQKDQADVRKYH